MKFKPLHDRVLIEVLDSSEKTAGGIIIPDTAQEKPQEGKVVAIGGGFVKYGEITTKLEALESQEQSVVDTSGIESSIAVLEEKVKKLDRTR